MNIIGIVSSVKNLGFFQLIYQKKKIELDLIDFIQQLLSIQLTMKIMKLFIGKRRSNFLKELVKIIIRKKRTLKIPFNDEKEQGTLDNV